MNFVLVGFSPLPPSLSPNTTQPLYMYPSMFWEGRERERVGGGGGVDIFCTTQTCRLIMNPSLKQPPLHAKRCVTDQTHHRLLLNKPVPNGFDSRPRRDSRASGSVGYFTVYAVCSTSRPPPRHGARPTSRNTTLFVIAPCSTAAVSESYSTYYPLPATPSSTPQNVWCSMRQVAQIGPIEGPLNSPDPSLYACWID